MSRRFVDWLTRNWPYKLISVFIAVFAWSWVQLEEIHEGQVRARVDGPLPSGLMSVEQLPTTVTLNLRGTGAAIRRAHDTVVRLAVDVSTVGVGEHSVEFTSFPVSGLPNAVDVLGCSPAAMRFNLDEVTHRKVKVQAVMVGDPSEGHLVQSVALEPSVVGLIGPRSVVSNLTEVKTRPLDVSGLSEDASIPVELELPRGVVIGDNAEPEARISVVPELERRVLSSVPVLTWEREGWLVKPSLIEVTLEGPAVSLEKVNIEDVVAFVHLPDRPERGRYEAPWGPKEGVRLRVLHGAGDRVLVVRVEPARVEVMRR